MSLFDVSERVVLDSLFGSGTPVSYEIGLSIAAPTEAGVLSEVSGGGYARVLLTNNSTIFPAATTATGVTKKKNGVAISFPMASGDWGLVTHWFIYDPTAGRPLNWGALIPGRSVSAGDILRISTGHLEISLD
jgi:hypothetical protein